MSRTQTVRAVVVCPSDRPEWRAVYDALLHGSGALELVRVHDLKAALRRLDDSRPTDLVVVCQWWPDEFTAEDVDALLGRAATARVVCCYGPWCESDGRRGTPWPAALRVPARRAAERILRELDVLAGRRTALPATASRDETAAFDLDADGTEPASSSENSGGRARDWGPRLVGSLTVLVCSPDAALRELLLVTVERQVGGLAASWSVRAAPPTSVGRADLVVWDLDPWCELTERRLLEFKKAWPKAGVVGVTGEPATADLAREVSWATDFVVPKDGLHDQLPKVLGRAVAQRLASDCG